MPRVSGVLPRPKVLRRTFARADGWRVRALVLKKGGTHVVFNKNESPYCVRHFRGSLRNLLLCGAAASAAFLAQTDFAMAQKISGAIKGTVTGTDGAPVSNADITVTNTGTGAMLTTTTTDGGTFENRQTCRPAAPTLSKSTPPAFRPRPSRASI